MLYLRQFFSEASPKAISGRTSYLRVRLEFLLYPQLIPRFFNIGGFGPPRDFTPASTCPWVAHPVSGLFYATSSPFYDSASLRLRTFSVLNLAAHNNSLDRSTKSTLSSLNSLQLLVNIGFQVLFHSPPGVLFTFPSRYFSSIGHQLVFSLGRWSSLLPNRFHVPVGTPDPVLPSPLSHTGLLPPLVSAFHPLILLVVLVISTVLYPTHLPLTLQFLLLYRLRQVPGLGSSAFARHYLRNHFCFLFLRVLRCFSSPRLPLHGYLFTLQYPGIYPGWVPPFGHPRVYGYLRLTVAFRSLSRPSSAPGA